MSLDRIAYVRLSSVYLPLATPISDAKVLTGRQKPMTEIAMLFAEVQTEGGHQGLGLSYSKRAGGPGQFAHAKEIAPALIGEDPSDIGKLWNKLCWAGASAGPQRAGDAGHRRLRRGAVGLEGPPRRAALWPSCWGAATASRCACYNTAGGFLHTALDQLLVNAAALASNAASAASSSRWASPIAARDHRARGGGAQASRRRRAADGRRQPAVGPADGAAHVPPCSSPSSSTWIEEPLDAYDHEGHAALAAAFDTPIATGEMLTSAMPSMPS